MEEKELNEFIQDGKLTKEWFEFFVKNDPYFAFCWKRLNQMHMRDGDKFKILAVALAKTKYDHQTKAKEKKEAKV